MIFAPVGGAAINRELMPRKGQLQVISRQQPLLYRVEVPGWGTMCVQSGEAGKLQGCPSLSWALSEWKDDGLWMERVPRGSGFHVLKFLGMHAEIALKIPFELKIFYGQKTCARHALRLM